MDCTLMTLFVRHYFEIKDTCIIIVDSATVQQDDFFIVSINNHGSISKVVIARNKVDNSWYASYGNDIVKLSYDLVRIVLPVKYKSTVAGYISEKYSEYIKADKVFGWQFLFMRDALEYVMQKETKEVNLFFNQHCLN